jgi:hypothetical protein
MQERQHHRYKFLLKKHSQEQSVQERQHDRYTLLCQAASSGPLIQVATAKPARTVLQLQCRVLCDMA